MRGINRVFLMGYLGADPELRATKNGKSFINLSLATHYLKRVEEGERQDTTVWHRITVWGTDAENCQKYLHKGSPLAIEGYLSKYSYEKEDGTDATGLSVVAREVHFLGSKRGVEVLEPQGSEAF